MVWTESLCFLAGFTGMDDTSWEPAQSLKGSRRLIQDFHETHPLRPGSMEEFEETLVKGQTKDKKRKSKVQEVQGFDFL